MSTASIVEHDTVLVVVSHDINFFVDVAPSMVTMSREACGVSHLFTYTLVSDWTGVFSLKLRL